MSENYKQLIKQISTCEATIGVVGLGYVGLPLMKLTLESGFKAVGFDVDQTKIDSLSVGQSYLEHIDISSVKKAVDAGDCRLSSSSALASECDVIILCVPTPLTVHREPDLSYVISSLESFLPFLKAGQAVVLESTTYPGTTEERLMPMIEQAGFEIGDDFFLIYSPEREDPGNKQYGLKEIPKVVSGISEYCGDIAEYFYGKLGSKTVRVSTTKAAEMTKILENTYRSVNIALVNELKVLANLMGIDIFEVINAAATKPFGFQAFYPGPGLGGHCIPIDPFYLTWKAREYGFNTRFIELAGEINTAMPDYVIAKIIDALNHKSKAINGSKVLIVGVAYKKNVGDLRESPGVEIIDKLQKLNADVSYHDPHVETLPKMRKFDLKMSNSALDAGTVPSYDICVIVTDHDVIDYSVFEHADLVVDARGRLDILKMPNVIRA